LLLLLWGRLLLLLLLWGRLLLLLCILLGKAPPALLQGAQHEPTPSRTRTYC
jgi:hypothetical protein